eukprot:scaffold69808_cov57-Phaeocystis_antarctica.AAC.1
MITALLPNPGPSAHPVPEAQVGARLDQRLGAGRLRVKGNRAAPQPVSPPKRCGADLIPGVNLHVHVSMSMSMSMSMCPCPCPCPCMGHRRARPAG